VDAAGVETAAVAVAAAAVAAAQTAAEAVAVGGAVTAAAGAVVGETAATSTRMTCLALQLADAGRSGPAASPAAGELAQSGMAQAWGLGSCIA